MKKILGYLLMLGGLLIAIFAIYSDWLLYRGGISLTLFIAYLVLYLGAGLFFFILGRRLVK